jgi:hypothetical protein
LSLELLNRAREMRLNELDLNKECKYLNGYGISQFEAVLALFWS